ncbi:VOC family protein [Chloroflexota bacterium]
MQKEKIMGNVDHVVIAVRDMENAKRFFSELLDTEFVDIAVVEEVGLRNAMSPTGLELIEPTRPDGDVAKFIDRRGEGLYALAFSVLDVDKARAKVEKMGIRVVGGVQVDEGPGKGIKEIWLHPKDNFGTYVLLTQGNPYHP